MIVLRTFSLACFTAILQSFLMQLYFCDFPSFLYTLLLRTRSFLVLLSIEGASVFLIVQDLVSKHLFTIRCSTTSSSSAVAVVLIH